MDDGTIQRPTARIVPLDEPQPQNMRVGVCRHGRGGSGLGVGDDTDLVTVEEPMEVRLAYQGNGERVEQSIAVTMRTPGDDFDLALGFLVGEGVVGSRDDVAGIAFCGAPSPDKGLDNIVAVSLAPHVRFDAQALTRHVFTSSSCGVCGKASLDAVRLRVPDADRAPFAISAATLQRLPDALCAAQKEFARTGGLHAAAAFDASGRIERLCEDVGRHNALDKLVGSYLAEGEPLLDGMAVLLSGRASFELVQKAAMTRAPLIAAIGPPSSLAIELAEEAGIGLVGFLKPNSFNVYVRWQSLN